MAEEPQEPAPPGGGAGDQQRSVPQDPGALLRDLRADRRRARLARHGYWFPLVLFGVLTCASVPFYILPQPSSGSFSAGPLQSAYLGGLGGLLVQGGLAYYWLAALLAGVAVTFAWYRWHGRHVGLRTPTWGYLVTGLTLTALALVIPILEEKVQAFHGLWVLMPGDLLIRGTFPFVIIAIGLCVLAWAERSLALSAIAGVYLAIALLATLYDIENILFRLGWNPSPSQWQLTGLPNVLLPALVLLISGAGAWAVQRRRREPA